MQERSIPEKIHNIINDSFSQLNDIKRSYLISSEHEDGSEFQIKYQLDMLKQLMQLELSIRKIQSLNNANRYQEKQDLVSERKEAYHTNGRPLKSVR